MDIRFVGYVLCMSIGVAILIENSLESGTRYLMLEQDRQEYGTGFHYAPPAGTLDEALDEGPEDTAVREVLEETGLEVMEDDLYELFETDASYGVDKLIWYRTELDFSEDDLALNHESDGYSFLTREEALEEELLEDTRKALERLG